MLLIYSYNSSVCFQLLYFVKFIVKRFKTSIWFKLNVWPKILSMVLLFPGFWYNAPHSAFAYSSLTFSGFAKIARGFWNWV